jgi:predicted HAD superfamily Cof-like phosphohydrolase
MTNPFKDIDTFHTACDQEPSEANYEMYISLIMEEYKEFFDARRANDRVEQLDALVDILVVTMGAIRAGGFDGEGAWKEVMKTNFAKIDPETGKVRKREDGKVLKPEGWKAPELEQFLTVKEIEVEGHPV